MIERFLVYFNIVSHYNDIFKEKNYFLLIIDRINNFFYYILKLIDYLIRRVDYYRWRRLKN